MSEPSVPQLRRLICQIGRRLYERGLISAAEGNISVRLSDGTFLCTPTSLSKGFLEPEQVALIDAKGNLLEGPLQPTSECRMHLAIYRAQAAANAVVHAHPPYAMALGVADIRLPTEVLPEVLGYIGEVPLLPFQTPGTDALADQVAGVCAGHRVIMMKHHGAAAWAEDLDHAWLLMEALESCCKATYLARTLGRMDVLPPEKVAELPRARPVGRST
jgi:L-fuculose-phosphate aldolase